VGAASVASVPFTESAAARPDSGVTVKRAYYNAADYTGDSADATLRFEQGDLVRVNLWIDYTKKAVNGSYRVTDYLPSGLAYTDGSAKIGGWDDFGDGFRCYAEVNGREITFYDYNGRFDKGRLYYYYARVINPGRFRAEGTLAQSLDSDALYACGADAVITIGADKR
jgi:uncharacterized protein YfaS (alpha-2-macroglobulin family)